MNRILNMKKLTSHGNREGRKAVAEILEAGLQAADPYSNTKKLFKLKGNKLVIGGPDYIPDGDFQTEAEVINLVKIDRIFVFGAGKGVQRIAKAIEDVLGNKLTGGHVIDKKGANMELNKIGVTLGAHPVPDEDCIKGCQEIIEMTKDLTEKDLVFTIAANGISSLLTLPVPGVTLEEVRQITYLMQIKLGVPTGDLNFIRNNLDIMKGGRISRYMRPAKCIHLVACDYNYDSIMNKNSWLHTLPDKTDFLGAIRILKKWRIWEEIPESIKKHFLKADPKDETVKPEEFMKYPFRVFILMPKKIGVVSMASKKAEELGFKAVLISNCLEAEAREAGYVMASIALTIEKMGSPFSSPCVLLSRGDLLVTVGNERGIGGRNQEFVLSMASRIAGSKNIVVGSVDTDGTDGPGTQFCDNERLPTLAGGLIDGYTEQEINDKKIDIYMELAKHNTTPVLLELDSGILTTKNISLNDLTAILIQGNREDCVSIKLG